jgi:hypothetical protein
MFFEPLARRKFQFRILARAGRLGHIRRMSTIAEIQDAIEKLPAAERKALSSWLSAREDDGLSVWEKELNAMASDQQVRAEVRRINQEFAAAETDGLGRA